MVSEKAEKILGIDASNASADGVAAAFWEKTEIVDRKIIATDDQEVLAKLLVEKDQLLEARALLEGISFQEVRKELVEKSKSSGIDPRVLIVAVLGWLIVMAMVIIACLK